MAADLTRPDLRPRAGKKGHHPSIRAEGSQAARYYEAITSVSAFANLPTGSFTNLTTPSATQDWRSPLSTREFENIGLQYNSFGTLRRQCRTFVPHWHSYAGRPLSKPPPEELGLFGHSRRGPEIGESDLRWSTSQTSQSRRPAAHPMTSDSRRTTRQPAPHPRRRSPPAANLP